MRPWETRVYWVALLDKDGQEHGIMAFSMETITSSVPAVDVTEAARVFNKRGIKVSDVARPQGEVDLLVGIQCAGLHPTRSIGGTVENLGLCQSKFGTGWLLEGVHPGVKVA